MKKFFILSAIALGVMTSCSEDDYVPSVQTDGNSIVFATQSDKQMTRSGSTITSLTSFTVDAVNADHSSYFSGIQFNYNGSKAVFESSTPYYWPVSSTMNFYAISNKGVVSVDEGNVPHYTYENWAGETDLVAATVIAGEKRTPYPLTFQHILSQISISAEASAKTEDLTYKLVGVDMTTPCTGKYSFANASAGFGTWEIDNSSEKTYSYSDAFPQTFDKNGSVSSGSTYWNILPVSDGKIKFNVEYQVFQKGKMIADYTGQHAKTCEVADPNLLSGKRYIYNFKLTRGTDDAITFTLILKDWQDSTTTDIVMPGGGDVPTVDDSQSITAVDMGLSVKWASANVGSTEEYEIGRYFYWGGTVGYTTDEINSNLALGNGIFSYENYWTYPSASINTNLSTIDGNDGANIYLGGNWRMPTKAEFDELINPSNCSRALVTRNGREGYEFTSLHTGNKIFLPYCGGCNPSIFSTSTGGYYWTSTIGTGTKSYMFCIANLECRTLLYDRNVGQNIRPVCD